MAFFILAVLPYVLLLAALVALTVWVARWRTPFRPLLVTTLILTTLLVTGFVAWAQHNLLTSKSSTAAIAYIFLPFYTLEATAICAGVAGALVYVVFFAVEKIRRAEPQLTRLPLLAVAVFLLTVSGWVASRHLHQQRLVKLAASPQTPAGELSRLQSRALTVKNTRVLEQLAANPALADAALAELFKGMVSGNNFKVLGKLAANPRLSATELTRIYELVKNQTQINGYATWRELARNRNTPPEILQALAGMKKNNFVRLCVAENSSTPSATLAQLAVDHDDQVRTWLTTNPSLPAEQLLALTQDPVATVRQYAESHAKQRGLSGLLAPLDPAMLKMQELGRRAADGDLGALDEIHAQYKILYADVDRKNDRQRRRANLQLMRAAFDIIGDAAGDRPSAFTALQRAAREPDLRGAATYAYGRAAAGGNRAALDALLHYEQHGWPLSSVCGALQYPADRGNAEAVDFLIAVLQDPNRRALRVTAANGLRGAAKLGNERASRALAEHDQKVLAEIKNRQ
ncbi:MAG: hypothetical protein LBK71_03415 [Verrucomicrobiales bacterium]|jgi:hypothetical protein|nr:hypothetical protein [Verrucomicrobiales bacterium]